MQQLSYHQKFCQARQTITDKEIHRLVKKYHDRHPTFSIDIQERTCKTIILACIYHYRHIEIDLRCESIYNDILHKFESNWSTDNVEYKQILNDILTRLNSSLANRSLDDQIESVIEQITKYFTQLKFIDEEEEQQQQTVIRTRNSSTSSSSPPPPPIEIVKYERSPQSRRQQLFERSLSWSQPLTKHPIRNKINSMLIESKF